MQGRGNELEAEITRHFGGGESNITTDDTEIIKNIIMDLIRRSNNNNLIEDFHRSYQTELQRTNDIIQNIENHIYRHPDTAQRLPGPHGFLANSNNHNFRSISEIRDYLQNNNDHGMHERIISRVGGGVGVAAIGGMLESILNLIPYVTGTVVALAILGITAGWILLDELWFRPRRINAAISNIQNEVAHDGHGLSETANRIWELRERRIYLQTVINSLAQARREIIAENLQRNTNTVGHRLGGGEATQNRGNGNNVVSFNSNSEESSQTNLRRRA